MPASPGSTRRRVASSRARRSSPPLTSSSAPFPPPPFPGINERDGAAVPREATSSASSATSSPSSSREDRGGRRRRGRAGARRLRPAARRRRPRSGARRGRAPVPGARHERVREPSARGPRRGAVRRLRRRRLGPAREPAAGGVPARGARVRRRASARTARIDAVALDADAAPGPPRARASSSASSAEGVRVVAPDVGGGFGAKGLSVEDVLVAWLARKTGRPVRWTESAQREHGRDAATAAPRCSSSTIGGSRDGDVAGVPAARPPGRRRLPAARRLPARLHRADGERRLRDPEDRVRHGQRRHEHDADRPVPRRRATRGDAGDRARDRPLRGRDSASTRPRCAGATSIPPDAFPLTTASGAGYDSGDYERALDLALETAGYDELRDEQRRRRESGDTRAARHRRQRLRRDHERARRAGVRRRRDHAGRRGHRCARARSRTARATRRRSR